VKEGEERGRTAEQEKHEGEDVQTEPMECMTTESGTQTTSPSTADAVTQTIPNDKPPRLLNDTGMSTEPPSTVDSDPLPALPSATSPLMMPAQPLSPLSTSLTATTTTSLPAPKLPPAPHKQRHLLPNQPIAPQPSPQLLRQSLISDRDRGTCRASTRRVRDETCEAFTRRVIRPTKRLS
jgi:hypothetical protein